MFFFRSSILNHMKEEHNFNVGHPDNLGKTRIICYHGRGHITESRLSYRT